MISSHLLLFFLVTTDDDVVSVADSEDSLVGAEDFRKAVDIPKPSYTRTRVEDIDQEGNSTQVGISFSEF